jgi:toxin ParE1/3/4
VTHRVVLSERAIEDLDVLHVWIAAEAGFAIANGYHDRLQARIEALSEFPNRGTPRDDLIPGLRTLTFERRFIIAYRVTARDVHVLRVISGQRELAPLFA